MASVVTGSISACQRPAVQRGVRQRRLATANRLRSKRFPGERPDHPDAGELLAHHPVDAVDQASAAAEDAAAGAT